MNFTHLRTRITALSIAISGFLVVATFADQPATEQVAPPSTVIVTTSTSTTTTTTLPPTTTSTTTTTTIPAGDWKCPQWIPLALEIGFPADEIAMIDRIMWRESRCNPASHNPNDPTWAGSRGLWQINGYWCIPNKYNPIGWMQEQGILNHCDDLFDPIINTRAALAIRMRQGGYGAWGF